MEMKNSNENNQSEDRLSFSDLKLRRENPLINSRNKSSMSGNQVLSEHCQNGSREQMSSQGDADMKKRENELAQTMMKRMDTLERELQDVQAKLQEAVQMIAKKDKELEELKSQILQDGMDKLDQNKLDKKSNKGSVDAELCFNKNNPKPNIQDPNYFGLNSDNIPNERRLSETVESRIKKVKALNKTDSSNKRKVEKCNSISEGDQIVNRDIVQGHESKAAQAGRILGAGDISNYSSDSSDDVDEKTSKEIEEEYAHLAGQLEEMEKFLGDYGLLWVGDLKFPNEDSYRKVQASIGFSPNFDKLIMLIGNLNERSSEPNIEVSGKLGKFKKADVLKLAIYADGIQLEDNPFREYSSESVQEFFKDLEDGYYPTELKGSYPDGVIFRVIDKRAKTFDEVNGKKVKPFSGKGHRLGRKQKSFEKSDPATDSLDNISNNNSKNRDLPIKDKTKIEKADTQNNYQCKEETTCNKEKDLKENINQTYADYEDKTDNDKIPHLTSQQEINTNKKDIPQNHEITNLEQIQLNQPPNQIIRPDNVETVTEETQTPSERNVNAREYNSEPNISFRDKINITNITYNEAPIILQDPSMASKAKYNETTIKDHPALKDDNHSPGMFQDDDFKAETVEGNGKFGLTEYSEKIAGNSPNIEKAIKRNILAENRRQFVPNQMKTREEGYPLEGNGMAEGAIKQDTMTEYAENFNENAKCIEETIRKNASSNTPVGSIFNQNQQFENITILGSKPQIEIETAQDKTELNRDGVSDLNEEFIEHREELQEDLVADETDSLNG